MAHASTPTFSTRLAPKAGYDLPSSRVVWAVISLSALVAIWAIAASLVGSRHLPGPGMVLGVMMREAAAGTLWSNLAITLMRVTLAFTVAMLIGAAIGIVIGSHRLADRFFDSWLVLFLNLPALVIIALCYVWLGTTELTAIVAVAINKIPNVAVQMREGARSLNRDLQEMAELYNFGRWKTLRHVTIPQLAPFFAAAARSGLALVWKIVLVVEALGGHPTGVGHQIHAAFGNYDVPTILAYALAFIVVIQIVELGILQPLQTRLNKWRR
ncbi:MAG: ABC transporter permease subunit [Hyphomicrobium sp.]|nr:ABC transporter permease subunit [Hyphomicrobium sp.]